MNRRIWLQSLAAASALPAAVETAQPPARLKSAICAYSFRQELQTNSMSYEDLVRLCAELEVDGLDMTVYWLPSTSDAYLMPLRRLAYRSGIDIYSISVRTDLCKPPAEQEKELALVKGWVDVAAKVGARHIRVFGGNVPKTSSENEAAGWVVELLKRASDYSGSKGVLLGLENHGGITEKAERIVDIIKRVDSPWVGINLDTGNFHSDVYRQIELCVPYAVNVQLKERVRVAGKVEESDWARVTAMLRKAGYKGYLALEYEEQEPAPTAVRRLVAKLRRTIGQVS
ncbi:MAG: sugar phosphate isomerase/epimerase [Bryobacteraceae bacterium]|nr:sugar phosphate isomerase/epimerase [Bryobacteraceae bacterium]MDW8377628.1 sugar phosphate isomerase/epimerase family protein [Bryobacterales bacterium]